MECNQCHQVFKDKRGLSVHQKRCRVDYSTKCKYCNLETVSIYVLENHLQVCKEYSLHKIKENTDTIVKTYTRQLEERDQLIFQYKEQLEQLKIKCIDQEKEIFSLQEEVRLQQKYLKNVIIVKNL